MGIAALISPLRIRREPAHCIDCGKCAKACLAALPVDRLIQIRSAECIGCLECVAVCPAEGALFLSTKRSRRVSPYAVGAAVLIAFIASLSAAKLSGHWHSSIPDAVYRHLIPAAAELDHP